MITSGQVRAARALVRWSAEKLAEEAKLGVATVRRADATDGPLQITKANAAAIQGALEAAGVEFIPENGGGAGVRLAQRSFGRLGTAAAHLDRVLTAFAKHRLPKAVAQEGVGDLQFVRAGPQATLMEGTKTIGMVTLRDNDVVFSPALPTGQVGDGHTPTEEDIWNWVVVAWHHSRKRRKSR